MPVENNHEGFNDLKNKDETKRLGNSKERARDASLLFVNPNIYLVYYISKVHNSTIYDSSTADNCQ